MTIASRTAGYLNKERNKIVSNATKLMDALHIHMCECLLHAADHGDVTLCQRLYDELPNGQRRESIKMWFAKMGPITARQGTWKLKEGWNKDMFKLEQAENSPFWVEFGNERPPRVFSVAAFMAMIENGPKRIEKALEEQKEDNQVHFQGNPDVSKQFFADILDFAGKWKEKHKPQDLGFEVLKPEVAQETTKLTKGKGKVKESTEETKTMKPATKKAKKAA